VSDELRDETTKPRSARGRWISNLGWLVGGGILTLLMLAVPLDIHPIDTWMHRLLGHEDMLSEANGAPGAKAERKVLFYRNPMDPTITSPVPAKDEMGMDYVPVYADEAGAGSGTPQAKGERKVLFYRNPMDPTITSPVPAKDEMGMDYVPVYADEAAETSGQDATVTIDPAVVQNMNVVTAPVERQDLSREIRTVGFLDYDQEKMVSVTTKFPGFVEKVYVNYVGEPVRKGQPLFDIYSPELVQTQEELLSALSFSKRLEGAPEEARRRAEELVAAARRRLGYWDISPAQIERLEASGRSRRTLTVNAPAGGVVMLRMNGLEGMAVKPGMELFHIADLSSLWLSVEVFEDQLPWLRVGSGAEITLSYFPGETFRGRVRFVEPEVAEKTRTVGLRLEVPNPDGRLRAGMYATVRFAPVVAHDAVVVPAQAVLRTGERNLVVVADGGGRFTPRQVQLGAGTERFVEVLSGVAPGEQVVTSAQFLIDSESNLREAIQKMLAAKKAEAAAAAAPAPPVQHDRH
jgi:Cu(I)/Ag(I) efflux system membrane fusion protein